MVHPERRSRWRRERVTWRSAGSSTPRGSGENHGNGTPGVGPREDAAPVGVDQGAGCEVRAHPDHAVLVGVPGVREDPRRRRDRRGRTCDARGLVRTRDAATEGEPPPIRVLTLHGALPYRHPVRLPSRPDSYGPGRIGPAASEVTVRVHLVDGTYELFRAHFSKRPSREAPDGRDVKATVGVVSSLLWLLADEDEAVTHLAVAFDNPIESWRNVRFPPYKDGTGVDPALLAQFDGVEDAVRAIGVTVWSMDEQEADDALGAAALTYTEDDRVEQVRIMTPDKDLGQVVRGERIVQVDRSREKVLRRGRGHRPERGAAERRSRICSRWWATPPTASRA